MAISEILVGLAIISEARKKNLKNVFWYRRDVIISPHITTMSLTGTCPDKLAIAIPEVKINNSSECM